MEGHQFGIFCIKMTSDNRYIVSVSNKFITFDVVTSDLARQVYPALEGLMVELELSQDNKFAAAYTNNNEIVLLNTLVSEFVKIENPFKETESDVGSNRSEKTGVQEYSIKTEIQGLVLLEGRLVIYSTRGWAVYDMNGAKLEEAKHPGPNCILKLQMLSLEHYSVIEWSGMEEDDTSGIQRWMRNFIYVYFSGLQSVVDGKKSEYVSCHGPIVINQTQTVAFLCDEPSNYTVSRQVNFNSISVLDEINDLCRYEMTNGQWEREMMFQHNTAPLLMMSLSDKEQWAIGTCMRGFKLWSVDGRQSKYLLLPHNVRNVNKKPGVSSGLVLSAKDKYAVSGIRKELYIWNMETEELSKVLYAHFQRIVDIKSLVVGRENSVITSSIDRSIKVWDLNYIFEEDHHIDKHELTIESVR